MASQQKRGSPIKHHVHSKLGAALTFTMFSCPGLAVIISIVTNLSHYQYGYPCPVTEAVSRLQAAEVITTNGGSRFAACSCGRSLIDTLYDQLAGCFLASAVDLWCFRFVDSIVRVVIWQIWWKVEKSLQYIVEWSIHLFCPLDAMP